MSHIADKYIKIANVIQIDIDVKYFMFSTFYINLKFNYSNIIERIDSISFFETPICNKKFSTRSE